MITALQLLVAAALAATPASRPACPPGQQIGPDTAGQCCWPGQAWAKTRGVCVGVPACPKTFVAAGESCSCGAGQVAGPDTQGNCCWPGQAWSASRARCVGVPTQCPAGLFPNEESCAISPQTPPPPPPLPPEPPEPPAPERPLSCPPGQQAGVDTGGHCCWPGQVWGQARGACVGVPQCPPTRLASAETCSCPAGQVSEQDMQGQCCFPGQVWSVARARCVGLPTQCPPGEVAEGEGCAAPLASDLPPPPPLPSSPSGVDLAPAAESKCPAEAQPEWPWASAPRKRELLEACRAEQQQQAAAPVLVSGPPPAPAAPAPAPAPTVVRAPDPPRPVTQRRTRVALTTGMLLGEMTGVALALPIRIGLFTLKPGEWLQGTASLMLTPSLFGGMQAAPYASYLNFGAGLGLGAGWHQRLGPFELFPHGGAQASLVYQKLNSNGAGWALNLVFRGVFGLTIAVPAGERTKFTLGAQAQLGGASTQGQIFIGVEF